MLIGLLRHRGDKKTIEEIVRKYKLTTIDSNEIITQIYNEYLKNKQHLSKMTTFDMLFREFYENALIQKIGVVELNKIIKDKFAMNNVLIYDIVSSVEINFIRANNGIIIEDSNNVDKIIENHIINKMSKLSL